jgi:TolB-like protein
MPNKLSQFWQELKRRNVFRVITVYAGAAFVIIELINNITEPLHLPEWTPTLVIILLLIGFPIVVIFSWIYDVHPEGGMVKTEPADKIKPEDVPKSSNSWKIASYISFVVIVSLVVLNIIPRTGKKDILDKSIAVLPFKNDSPDQEMYFINGVMEEILDDLCKIEDLRVVSRSSVEQYRDNPKPIPVVAEEMDVDYVLEGSGQRDGNNIRLTVQLLDAGNDQHIWSETYYREISNIFELQSEISKLVAGEIQAKITPAENELIEKIPTANLTAYDFYQRGKEEHWKYRTDPYNLKALEKAEEQYNKALSYDSTFGHAYLGLAIIDINRKISTEYLSEDYLDGALVLINRALSYDNTLAEAYVYRGIYYAANGYKELALDEYNKALEINPNSWEAYSRKANLYWGVDLVFSIENLHKAISLYRGRELPALLGEIAYNFRSAGFSEISRNYTQEKLNLDNDSISYFLILADYESDKGNHECQEKYLRKVYMMDSTNILNLFELGFTYGYLGQHKKSLVFFEKWLNQLDYTLEKQSRYQSMHRVGYAYWKNQRYEKAEYYFNLQMEYCNRSIDIDNPYAQAGAAYYDRAGVYAFRGEREKAFEDLRKGLNQITGLPLWMNTLIKRDPLFDSIRDELEFQKLVLDAEAMYQEEHERVRQWLEEN